MATDDAPHTPQDLPELLLPSVVCEQLKVSRSWLYAAAQDGRIPAVRLGGPDGPLRFVADDLAAWLEEARTCVRPGQIRCGRRPIAHTSETLRPTNRE